MTPKCPDCKRDQDDCICASPASAPADCSPTLTECPRCHNDVKKCDGVFAAPTPPVSEDQKDAERLNWLDEQGMIAIGHKGYGEYRYYAGDLFPAIRQVIDQARREDKP